jgi:flagellar biosynthesis GTPase FlhF
MPNFAVLNDQIITTDDIYKFNIPKTSDFLCFTCEKRVQFRQQRNADNNFKEHFFHPNTVKDTHIECEKATLKRDADTWHNKISNLIQRENREIIRKRDDIKHIVDAYDEFNDMGIEFQNSPISVEAIQSRDATTYLDWIFNVENQYIRKGSIGNFVVCEIPHDNWEKAVKAVKNSVYLYTGYSEWILLETRESYHIEIEKKRRNVWIGKPITFQEVYDATCLQNILTQKGLSSFNFNQKHLEQVRIIYARCKQSMYLLDSIHRDYVYKHIFEKGEVMAIKSVAGSGKTTTLLELAKIHKNKKILYLAFNRSLISEIQTKLNKQRITNMHPSTFDSLLRNIYIKMKKNEPNITYVTPQTIQNIIPWLKGKAFPIRKDIVKLFSKFCGQNDYSTIQEFCKYDVGKDKPLLETLWKKCLSSQLINFESMRKLSVLQHWFKDIIDKQYDMIMIDETQDFDIMMLRMLLDDTTIPKIFVGDPKQSIYKWRGCINGFDYMPNKTLVVEFYSTFRIGEPACEEIRKRFDDCWMISKSKNETILSNELSFTDEEKYTYLFRSWKCLLQTAENMKNIWISGYDAKIESIRRQHQILQKGYGFDDDEFEDDLPKFLKSISEEELETMIAKIEENTVMKDNCRCKFYTIHSYKGLEDDNIRISNDIHTFEDDDANIYYVALTRGMKYIIED